MKLLFVSMLVLTLLTYKYSKVFNSKDVSKGNIKNALYMYSTCLVSIVIVNVLF